MLENNDQLLLDEHDDSLLNKIYEMLALKIVGPKTQSPLGRTTKNIIQETDQGKVCIRMYSKDTNQRLETGHPLFEIEALNFFTRHGIKVPVPIPFGDKLYFETNEYIIFAYFLLPGTTICRQDLSSELAKNMGLYLQKFLEVSSLYSLSPANENSFINSFEYILQMAERTECTYLEVTELDVWSTMKACTKINVNILAGTPKGIVHADYFFENILSDENGNISGVIDFGDSYYGYILHDAVIGSMEVSVIDEEIWDLEIFSAFLNAISSFLRSNAITFEQFYETMKVNCLRFALYTLSDTFRNGGCDDNVYINRYRKLLSKDLQQKICGIFKLTVQA